MNNLNSENEAEIWKTGVKCIKFGDKEHKLKPSLHLLFVGPDAS